MRKPTLILSLVCAALLAPLSLRAPQAQTVAAASAANARVIVKYKADSALLPRKTIQSVSAEQAGAQQASQAQALGQRIGIALSAGAGITERSHVVFASGITSAQLAQRLSAESDIEYAVPDVLRKRFAAPNDPFYPTRAVVGGNSGGPTVGQWYLKPPGPATPVPTAVTANTAPSSIDAEGAWAITTGSSAIVVAVLDTGIRFDHADFQTVANGGNLLPGYDMISVDSDGTFTTSNDGDGRDADASDPGDFVVQADAGKGGCTQADVGSLSSWHGTETAGLIGAVTGNGVGIASVGRNIRVLPVRVLGKCGGFDSDIVAGMLWAAGVSTPPGVPVNAAPARVINMSLGGIGACDATAQAYVDAAQQITAAGTVIVASAGNSAGHAVSLPADCPGVIGVAGLRHIGTKVGFSDLGPEITISAPGGNCINITPGSECLYPILTTSNSGTTTPVAGAAGAIYSDSFTHASLGTSFSAPLVTATVALMLSMQPALTPDEVRFKLQNTARTFPTSTVDESGATISVCTLPTASSAPQDQCVCSAGLCGAGMLDARAAVLAAAGVQARIAVTTAVPTALQQVTFDSAPSLAPVTPGASIASRQWTLSNGGGIVTALTAPTNGATVSATPTAAGSFIVLLTMTDSSGVVSAETTSVTVAAAPVTTPPATSGGGGGGALGAGWLLLLLGAVVALRVVPAARP
ncbi:MAG TPA: S8 family serine peptidase [Caldimonas sp.]